MAEVERIRAAVDQLLNPSAPPPQYSFTFDKFLRKEYRFGLSPDRPACKAFQQGHCPLGSECPDKHQPQTMYNNLICKHWLRGLCKKGEACEFLHEYNLRKMPECNFFARHQSCAAGDDCPYSHVDPAFKRPSCPHFDRGFCPLGPLCANRHVKKATICPFYLAGFCPDGRDCERGAHPRFPTDLKPPEVLARKTVEEEQREREERERDMRAEDERDRDRDDRDDGPGRGGRDYGEGRGKFGGRRWDGKRRGRGRKRHNF
ncbi:hypothetical protein EJ06DRAFT_510475 [Trichodelitschia bisporula]|uniref:mRNA 3'-end-processing protein n=1 Tax=Trichodelitschia bisporula TaxID=703511 RepID=A0A6G1HWI7_9PEZI|nr:hypothetical protein EJ06DRAFT_510475 [Trichodelitschia bisporula]